MIVVPLGCCEPAAGLVLTTVFTGRFDGVVDVDPHWKPAPLMALQAWVWVSPATPGTGVVAVVVVVAWCASGEQGDRLPRRQMGAGFRGLAADDVDVSAAHRAVGDTFGCSPSARTAAEAWVTESTLDTTAPGSSNRSRR